MKIIIGRKSELKMLETCFSSGEAELLAVYGRRRIGKTFLIRNFFKDKGTYFEVTGLKDGKLADQLQNFARGLQQVFPQKVPVLSFPDWNYSFQLLTAEIKRLPKNKPITLFFDELPWLATPRSGFLQQLDYFWNREWSQIKNLKVVLCGSAASWMIEKLIRAKGGLHNRLTGVLKLKPLTLAETQDYLKAKKVHLNFRQTLELYMAFGGVPFYLNQAKRGLSATQIINQVCFRKEGRLSQEFSILFSSLFNHSANHEKIIHLLAKHPQGLSRAELVKKTKIPSGTGLNRYFFELEEAGFIASFIPYQRQKKDIYYRIIDEYSLFYLKWIHAAPKGIFTDSEAHYWEKKIASPGWRSWAGLCFEMICLKHAKAIQKKLGIERIPTETSTWRWAPPAKSSEKGAQIDLLFDRGDGIISLCEIKFSEQNFVINKSYAQALKTKIEVFQKRLKVSAKHLFLTMITTHGVKKNAYYDEWVHSEVLLEDLFVE